MKIAKDWILENRGIEIPAGEVSAEWFIDNDLPMIVSCSCCETTMVLPSAMVDDDGYIYCGSCAEQKGVDKMTNEEKFAKGIVIYKTEDDVICELWGSSTKHADTVHSMKRDIEQGRFAPNGYTDNKDYDIFQWLLCVASWQTWKHTAKKIVEVALEEWCEMGGE